MRSRRAAPGSNRRSSSGARLAVGMRTAMGAATVHAGLVVCCHARNADYERLTLGVLQCRPGTQMFQFCTCLITGQALSSWQMRAVTTLAIVNDYADSPD